MTPCCSYRAISASLWHFPRLAEFPPVPVGSHSHQEGWRYGFPLGQGWQKHPAATTLLLHSAFQESLMTRFGFILKIFS